MKKKQRPEPMVGPSTTIFNFFVSIVWNEIERKAKTKESKRMNKRGREKRSSS